MLGGSGGLPGRARPDRCCHDDAGPLAAPGRGRAPGRAPATLRGAAAGCCGPRRGNAAGSLPIPGPPALVAGIPPVPGWASRRPGAALRSGARRAAGNAVTGRGPRGWPAVALATSVPVASGSSLVRARGRGSVGRLVRGRAERRVGSGLAEDPQLPPAAPSGRLGAERSPGCDPPGSGGISRCELAGSAGNGFSSQSLPSLSRLPLCSRAQLR